MILYDTIRHDTLRYDTTRYNTIYDTIRHDTIQHDTIQYDTIRYDKMALYNDMMQYDMIQYDMTWHDMIFCVSYTLDLADRFAADKAPQKQGETKRFKRSLPRKWDAKIKIWDVKVEKMGCQDRKK